MFTQIKRNSKRLLLINSVVILAAILVLAPILGTNTYNAVHASISSSVYDNIQKQFDNLMPFEVPQIDKKVKDITQDTDDTESQSAQTAATTDTSCQASVYDNFDSTYLLGEGKISPNGEWKNIYSGYGSTGVKKVDWRTVFYLSPKVSTSPSETHAAMVKSVDQFCNFTMDVDINTVKQLRKNSPPNKWEVGWIDFRYVDKFHHYSLLFKPNGIELGKKDCDTCTNPVDGQRFLETKSTPKMALDTWNHIKIDMVDNHIKVFINGELEIDYIDTEMSPEMAKGSVAMYSEDAYVLYNNMDVSPK